jgi:type II secretion system protein N
LGPIKFTDIAISPTWSSLLSTTPAAQIAAQVFSGSIEAQIDSAQHIKLAATSLHWEGPIPQLPTLNIQTTIAHLNAAATGTEISQLEQLQLELSELRISGLKKLSVPVDSLDFGSIKLQLSQKQQNIHLDQLTSSGGDISISCDGHITRHRNLIRSRIDLEFTLTPRQDLDPAITTMLPLFAKKQQDGSYTVRLSGTLAQPRVR